MRPQVLGAHMVGPDSAEIMQGIAIALKAGAKKVCPKLAVLPSSAVPHVTADAYWWRSAVQVIPCSTLEVRLIDNAA